MLTIGFSTGALAYAEFHRALRMLTDEGVRAVELSALRMPEWMPLRSAIGTLDLSSFNYVSMHLPSLMNREEERLVVSDLLKMERREWPLVLHPDTIRDFSAWRDLGARLCIENMDKRKPIGRNAGELERIFQELPEAKLCFDMGHARQVDPTMIEAYAILESYRDRIVQVHVSEVNSLSKHDVLSYCTMQGFRDIAHLIPAVPLILETPVSQDRMRQEINKVRFALLPLTARGMVA